MRASDLHARVQGRKRLGDLPCYTLIEARGIAGRVGAPAAHALARAPQVEGA